MRILLHGIIMSMKESGGVYMKYLAKIYKTDRLNFMINMESLSFYVEKALRDAGIEFTYENENASGNVVVLRDDIPLLKPSTIKMLIKAHEISDCAYAVAPNEAVFVVRENIYNDVIISLNNKESFSEFVQSLRDRARGDSKMCTIDVSKMEIEDIDIKDKEFLIVDSCVKLSKAARTIRKRINKKHMRAGVVLTDAKTTYIGPRVEIGEGSIVLPGTFLEGESKIGRGCVIGPDARLVNMTVGDRTSVSNSVAFESKVGCDTQIGPFAYIRPHCGIGDHVKIGDFVEVKNAVIGNNTKASHLTYIGDADLGEGINMGCGTITVNYDGTKKSRTVIEDGAFIGSNSNLIAPVTVKKGGFVAAGSTITDEVPQDALSIARARQVNKTDWKIK